MKWDLFFKNNIQYGIPRAIFYLFDRLEQTQRNWIVAVVISFGAFAAEGHVTQGALTPACFQ